MNCIKNAGIYTAMLAIIVMVSAVIIPVADVSAEDADTCTVNYIVGEAVSIESVPVVDGNITLKEFSDSACPTGQKFVAWTYNGVPVVDNSIEAVKNTTYTVTASFEPCLYNVTFIVDGVTTSNTYVYNATATVPSATAPEGYTFAGWSNGTATITAIPAVTENVTYVAVYEITDVPVETFTVTFMVGGEVFATQTVESVKDAILPYIDGYSWGEAVIDAKGNAVITAITDPVQPENSFGITNTELAIIIGAFLAVILALFIIAYKLGFIEIGKKGVVKE